MESEDIVTKILSTGEILEPKKLDKYQINPLYDLGDFLNKKKSEPNKYGTKYKFVK